MTSTVPISIQHSPVVTDDRPGPVLVSGGAMGADATFSLQALQHDIPVITMSFSGHQVDRFLMRAIATRKDKAVVALLTDEELEQGRSVLNRVITLLKRKPLRGHNAYIQKLLLRDYWQIKRSSCVYAVGKQNEKQPSLHIDGGTAYACEMFVASKYAQPGPIPLYFFDQRQEHGKWLQAFRRSMGSQVVWRPLADGTLPPAPKPGTWFAAIGTRELNPQGYEAIQNLFQSWRNANPAQDVQPPSLE